MNALNEFLLNIDPKIRLGLMLMTLTIAKDVYNYNREKALAEANGETVRKFNYGLAVPMWYIGFMSGFGIGSGIEIAVPPETPPVVMEALHWLRAA